MILCIIYFDIKKLKALSNKNPSLKVKKLLYMKNF